MKRIRGAGGEEGKRGGEKERRIGGGEDKRRG